MKLVIAAALLAGLVPAARAVLPPTNPPWEPEWDLSLSSISMQCNSSGWSSYARGSEFGIMSYDWSNDKADWAQAQPMDCEERLLAQAENTKSMNAKSRVFVYRNIVKALPWFSSIRKILDDPAYEGFFLKFDPSKTFPDDLAMNPCAAENATKCSAFYHDQEQTPSVDGADGTCPPPEEGGCDCGTQPCGEYLFDHRNSSVADWLIENHILSDTAIGSPSVDGMFMDDFWCSNLVCEESNNEVSGCPCNDPVQGATEVDANQQKDMGLSDEDIRDLYYGWDETMQKVQQAILDNGAYTWSLIKGQDNANASPTMLSPDTCASALRSACDANSDWQQLTNLFGISYDGTTQTFPQLEQEVAFFLLARGDYSYWGFGSWGMTWPFQPEPAHGELPPLVDGLPVPDLLKGSYGVPSKVCAEVADGVFERTYEKGSVKLDCNTFVGELP
jgi:hypothetical protein